MIESMMKRTYIKTDSRGKDWHLWQDYLLSDFLRDLEQHYCERLQVRHNKKQLK